MNSHHIVDSVGTLLAIHLYGEADPGIKFFTENDQPFQLAVMRHQRSTEIQAHIHKRIERKVDTTSEVLVMTKGAVQVDFYDSSRCFVSSRKLYKGEALLILSGGHGFRMLEDSEWFYVKQGPYAGDAEHDKTHFGSFISLDEVL